ncbi:MAG: DNA topoisomerase IV subunit A [Proteobacteria bacterium]|nr:DNA topoisomerase IV subunit A [Pseudomonadota bacterium]
MNSQYGRLHNLFEKNFLEYSSYVIRERAIPDIHDGLKPVQRRILQTLFNMEDGRFHKVANVVGETMKLHPHGDASIFSALVNLANKEYLIERQGNFGNIYTGDQASAARYIECRLTPLAKEILFNKDLTQFVESYDSRMMEPVTLPAKIPLLLLLGADGIAVGMATKIMPHNFCELLEAQIKLLHNEEITLYPDFQKKGLVDVSHYDHGNGRIRCRARIEEASDKTIIVKDIPHGTTTQSLIESVEKAAKAGKIKILSINDYTAEDVEVEINLARGVYAKETIEALYAFTDCEVAITPNLTLIKDNTPLTCTVEEVLEHNTQKLVHDLTKELEIDLGRFQEKLHARLLEQIFIEERLYKQIEEETSYKAVIQSVAGALQPFTAELLRPVTNEDIERLLEIKIKRISRYDINKQQKEIKDIRSEIKKISHHLKDMVGYTVFFLGDLLKKYGHLYPRQTELCEFEEVTVRSAALANLVVGYQRATGFLGHNIKAEDEKQDFTLNCSEYDRLLLIFDDGMYKVIPVSDKLFIGHELAWIGVVEDGLIFNILYRDGLENLTYAKRFTTPKFILDKEYRLFPEDKRSKILLLLMGEGASAHVGLAPSPRAKSNVLEVYFDEYLLKNPNAKGKRISPRVVRRVTDSTGKAAPKPQKQNMTLLGLVDATKESSTQEENEGEGEGKDKE